MSIAAVIEFTKSLPWRLIGMSALATTFFIGGCQFGGNRKQAEWDKETRKIVAQVEQVQQKQAAVSASVDQQSQKTQETVRTVFRDRIIYQDREVPREIIVRQDSGCAIPNRFVSLWNSANRAELPDPASVVDESASGIVLSDVTAQKDQESEICHANTEQLKLLQEWVRQQQAATH